MLDNQAQIEALKNKLKELAIEKSGEAADYVEEFAVFTSNYLVSMVRDPEDDDNVRLESMSRAVAETLKEMAEDAANEVLSHVMWIAQTLIGLARAAGSIA